MVDGELLPKRLFFLSKIVKGWHHFWVRWSQARQEGQLTGIHIMVQSLVWTSSFLMMQGDMATQKQSWASTTLFQLQWRTRAAQSWRGLEGISHLMRWRYFILTHPPKFKITRTEFNWKWSDAFNITQTFQFLFLSFFSINKTELISGIRKCKVVKRNLHRKAQLQPSNSKNLIVWICGWNGLLPTYSLFSGHGCQNKLFRLQAPDLVMYATRSWLFLLRQMSPINA